MHGDSFNQKQITFFQIKVEFLHVNATLIFFYLTALTSIRENSVNLSKWPSNSKRLNSLPLRICAHSHEA